MIKELCRKKGYWLEKDLPIIVFYFLLFCFITKVTKTYFLNDTENPNKIEARQKISSRIQVPAKSIRKKIQKMKRGTGIS